MIKGYMEYTPKLHFGLLFLILVLSSDICFSQSGTLVLTIIDDTNGNIAPARLEIRDSLGVYHVADDPMLSGGDCNVSDEGSGVRDLESTLALLDSSIYNKSTKSTQFYSSGRSTIQVPSGTTRIRVYKGPEYEVIREKVVVEAGKVTKLELRLNRWINMPEKGWYSSDDHLHIARPVKELNPYISKMMQAEDVHVANLLQFGKVKNSEGAIQHAFGKEGLYQEGIYILATGQENPRSHFLGHTITLGADTMLFNQEEYLIYRLIWEEAVSQGAINGYAHAHSSDGDFLSPLNGLAVLLPHDLLHFMEVLQQKRGEYGNWYDVLNLGFKVTPTAGSDYPCFTNIPGRERFYTKVEGEYSYQNWLEGVHTGRTFVTTGPMLEFKVNSLDMGSEINLEYADSIHIKGNVQINPHNNSLKHIELIQNGEVIRRISRKHNTDQIELDLKIHVAESSWYAIRAYGMHLLRSKSIAHSSPIYVSVSGTKNCRTDAVAAKYHSILCDMEELLADQHMEHLAEMIGEPMWDAVPKEVLYNNRHALLEEINEAKAFFAELMEQ